ncbi:DUF2017 family protein [Actinotalea sp.]|uniref:DUF2017 family protein n=1 Tax=Actinotalea sp. TaxID=1872145 RepID=UPI0035677E59
MTLPLREFRRDGEGRLVARIDRRERAVLAEVVEGVVDLLASRGDELRSARAERLASTGVDAGEESSTVEEWPAIDPPQDPALLRLLPDAAAEAELAAELRRLTEADLRDTTSHQVGLLHAALVGEGPEVLVAGPDARSVAAALTDVRLVLAERLGLRTDADSERLYVLATADAAEEVADEEATARFLSAVYLVLGELQESLVARLVEGLPPVRGEHL